MSTGQISRELEHFFAAAQEQIESSLRRLIAPADGQLIRNLDDGMAYALGLDDPSASGGKRVRPLLCLLVCDSLGGNTSSALPFATAIELMHNFCLVHDDIEDGDEFRRGRPAVWKTFGLPHAVNIGDYLFTKIFEALLWEDAKLDPEQRIRLFRLMNSTLDHTHRGQALDMNARTMRIKIEDYMRLVTEKTGYYLAAPLVAGAISAGSDSRMESILREFGLVIGPMFQIRDDLIDLTDGKGREAIGSDLREGKRSFMVAFTFEHGSAQDADELENILATPRQETNDAQIEKAMRIFENNGSLDAARRECEKLRERAFALLDPLPDQLRGRLEEVTAYLAGRRQ